MEYNYGICGIPINQLNKMIQSCLCISQFQLRGGGGGGSWGQLELTDELEERNVKGDWKISCP